MATQVTTVQVCDCCGTVAEVKVYRLGKSTTSSKKMKRVEVCETCALPLEGLLRVRMAKPAQLTLVDMEQVEEMAVAG